MAFIKFDVAKELQLVAAGKRAHIPVVILAALALPYVQATETPGVSHTPTDDSFDLQRSVRTNGRGMPEGKSSSACSAPELCSPTEKTCVREVTLSI